ncbi:hypothetical protein MRB53_026992 [Persea americana]|uniref:Uncharacterized protein n=1 Tax=Persea americana TaxID=3435 RepID=A0ACC2LJL9_PERAE|nr:hypothetical protein MRB53_026992 [Persea americana]
MYNNPGVVESGSVGIQNGCYGDPVKRVCGDMEGVQGTLVNEKGSLNPKRIHVCPKGCPNPANQYPLS